MLVTALLLVAMALAAIELIRSRLESLLAWAAVIGFGVLAIIRL